MGVRLVRQAAKAAAANVLHHTGLRRAMVALRRAQSGGRRLLVVAYHRVVEDFTGELQRSIPGLLISQETFRKHLEHIASTGYEFATMDQFLGAMGGTKRTKKDLCLVTFDDGYRDVYRYASPVMERMGVPSIVYLPAHFIGTQRRFNHDRLFHLVRLVQAQKFMPLYDLLPTAAAVLLEPVLQGQKTLSAALDDFIGEHATATLTSIIDGLEKQLGGGSELVPPQGDLMGWDEVRRMMKGGTEFGAHTLGHTVLTLEPKAVVEREILESKTIIERELGATVRDFAYCNGWYSDEIIQVLLKHGFRSGVTTEDLLNRVGGDPFTIKRKVLWENFSVGLDGTFSAPLLGCHVDDLFGLLGVNNPVPGRRQQRELVPNPALDFSMGNLISEGA
jgi:peptidoglycan/xylan/chitin deacetylase (PgdA/CDA1 family)